MSAPSSIPTKRRAGFHPRRTPRRKRRFSPWREDFVATFVLGAVALFGLYRGLASFTVAGALVGVGIGGVGGFAALAAWKNGMRRWYGKHLEDWAVSRLSIWLKRKKMDWQAGRMVGGLGDADLLVQTRSGPVVIEIKSWQRWRNQERERAGGQQTLALMQSLNACAGFIWLPRGRPTFMQRLFPPQPGGVRAVFGNERVMFRKLLRLHRSATRADRLVATDCTCK